MAKDLQIKNVFIENVNGDKILRPILDEKFYEILDNTSIREGTYFITGATGFIGSYITLSLLYLCECKALNIKVIIAVRNMDKAEKIYKDYVDKDYFEIVIHNMTDEYVISEKIDYIIHAAGVYMSLDKPYDLFTDNVISVKNILMLANTKRVRKILLISTASVYGDLLYDGLTDENRLGGNNSMKADLSYSESKRASEYMFAAGLKQFSLCGNVIRLFSVYGLGMNTAANSVFSDLLRQAISQNVITIKGTGKGIRNFSYISDVIYGIFTVLYSGDNGQAYNVGSKNANCSILDLALMLRKKINKDIKVIVNGDNIQGDDRETIQAPSFELIGSLAEQPATSLEDGLDRMLLYIKAEYELE